mgnify:CR=1 FL=1
MGLIERTAYSYVERYLPEVWKESKEEASTLVCQRKAILVVNFGKKSTLRNPVGRQILPHILTMRVKKNANLFLLWSALFFLLAHLSISFLEWRLGEKGLV